MPIFVDKIRGAAGLPEAVVFAFFVLSSCGAITGYALAGKTSEQSTEKSHVGRLVLGRSLLAFILLAALQSSSFNVLLAVSVLVLMGFLFAVFMVHILSLSMELVPAGKAGLVNVLIGLGAAFGSFAGPFIAQALGFLHVFVITGVIFFAAFIFFKLFA
jgi:MFS family permease